jgi:hypothetical protein
MMPHPFDVRGRASPTAPVPPAVAADTPPVYYALFHSSKHLPQKHPPYPIQILHPHPIYIFV